MFKLNAKLDEDSLLYLLSHFECNGHTVHMLTQWHLPPPLTSTVKLSLFTHGHSSPLSLAARLHWCCTIHSYPINNGWNFSDRPCVCVCVCIKIFFSCFKAYFSFSHGFDSLCLKHTCMDVTYSIKNRVDNFVITFYGDRWFPDFQWWSCRKVLKSQISMLCT